MIKYFRSCFKNVAGTKPVAPEVYHINVLKIFLLRNAKSVERYYIRFTLISNICVIKYFKFLVPTEAIL